MNRDNTEDVEDTGTEGSCDDLPERIREGVRAEQEMWEYAKKLKADILKPRGILGFFGYRIRLP